MHGIDLFGKLVKKDTTLYQFLQQNKSVRLVDNNDNTAKILNKDGCFVDLNLIVTKIWYSTDNADNLINHFEYVVGEHDKWGTYNTVFLDTKDVDYYHFSHLIHSTKAYKNKDLLDIAKEMMPLR